MAGTVTFTHDDSEKENIPPLCNNGEKKKNPIPIMPQSFKRKGKRSMKKKRVPLADITILFNNSAQEQNGVSSIPSASVLLQRSTPMLLRGSKTLRMGFR
ncbi:hypothetical protein Fmac_019227 [Flemingia macrophylla]|uniref:Uncharacterized protein n=1 Tax=Flemingia macrophylla TaxID=520843 RepID=A0ABD1M791_9FABA